jgi:hypothetical protein
LALRALFVHFLIHSFIQGSFWGFEEAKLNVGRITDGIKRGVQNQGLRELRGQGQSTEED